MGAYAQLIEQHNHFYGPVTKITGDENVVASDGGIAAGRDVRGSVAAGGDAREVAAEKAVVSHAANVNPRDPSSDALPTPRELNPRFRLAAVAAMLCIVVGVVLLVTDHIPIFGLAAILAGVATAIQAYRLWKGI